MCPGIILGGKLYFINLKERINHLTTRALGFLKIGIETPNNQRRKLACVGNE